jgi:hypothetical protein
MSADEVKKAMSKTDEGWKDDWEHTKGLAKAIMKNPFDSKAGTDYNEKQGKTATGADKFSDKEIKMAFGVLNDKRYHQGNYSGAVDTIEKIAKGLSKHPSVANALKRANEDLDYITDKLAKILR